MSLPHGEVLAVLRVGLGLGLRDAAKLLGVSIVDLGRRERDKTPLEAERLSREVVLLLKPTVEDIAAGRKRLASIADLRVLEREP